jgi:hypothetical protein
MPTLKPAKPAILRVADRPTLLSREKLSGMGPNKPKPLRIAGAMAGSVSAGRCHLVSCDADNGIFTQSLTAVDAANRRGWQEGSIL